MADTPRPPSRGARIATGSLAAGWRWLGRREQLPLIVLVAVAALLRVLVMAAYRPALFFSDSWGYLFTAFTGHPVSLSYLRPNGYAVLIRLLTVPGRDLEVLVAIQHLSGLVLGVLVYAALLRARAPRLLALGAAALVLLDGYRITLEHYVMPDSLFTLTLVVAALLLAWPRLGTLGVPEDDATRRAGAAGRSYASSGRTRLAGRVRTVQGAAWHLAAGLLVAAAILQREAAIFAIPAFLLYLTWPWVGWRSFGAFTLAMLLPVLAYAAIYQSRLGVFGISESDGWTLYGRVAGFADCAGAGIPFSERRLCETVAQRASHPDAPTWYIWDGSSPAARLFDGGHQTRQIQEHSNRLLGDFSHRVVLNQPLAYLDATFSDVLRYFTPGAVPFNDAISATSLPVRAAAEARSERVRRRVIPTVHPQVGQPATFLRAYRRIIHVPRPVLALLVLVSLLGLVVRVPARREVLLLSGSGFLLILGTSATAGFGLRYLMAAVPFLAVGGSLALADLFRRPRGWRVADRRVSDRPAQARTASDRPR